MDIEHSSNVIFEATDVKYHRTENVSVAQLTKPNLNRLGGPGIAEAESIPPTAVILYGLLLTKFLLAGKGHPKI